MKRIFALAAAGILLTATACGPAASPKSATEEETATVVAEETVSEETVVEESVEASEESVEASESVEEEAVEEESAE